MTGRPSLFSQELANAILDRLCEGESLRSVCRDPDMPGLSTVVRWLASEGHEEFRAQYARACEARGEADADKVTDYGDRCAAGDLDPAAARVAMDAAKWSAEKRVPKKYGPRTTLAGDPEAPLQGMTPEQVEARIAELTAKRQG